ncbi:DNA mismatch repair protein MutT [Methylobacterium sp. Leaf399]|uniref:CoA pyrophosphatase n=1 Tax=Methylobacterium sp. Leaf399 TaxID=1736364 RepID=UPI0006FD73B9|nr:CoA pyrophosphatase [Methylobacterium sp. Leaf399]KQT18704.1 DNA mismatch repair protein MutT [Methylobacterium sp. Leaf399]
MNGARPDSLAAFLERAAAGLSADAPRPGDPTSNPRGDHDLDADGIAVAPPGPHRHAAVLVPVVARHTGLSVLFTQRSAGLRDHSGQISFPGGKIDPADPGPAGTALREAWEEIGLASERVGVLGYLDPYLSATGFLVVPVVGLVEEPLTLALNPDEVAEVFEVPLDVLMDPAGHSLGSGAWRGRTRRYYAITHADRLIWGLTAGIVRNLYERLWAPGDTRASSRRARPSVETG